MKAAFHKDQGVLEKISEIIGKDPSRGISDFDRERSFQVMKYLDCYSTYTGRTRHLKIEGIHHDNPTKARFELKEGQTTTVLQYYKDKYNIDLKS